MAGIRLGTEDLVFKLGNSDCKVYIGDTLLYQPYSPSGQTPCFEVVDALSGASGDYVDVYNTSDSKWYKKNNLRQYEEYGLMPTVDALSGVTYYVGKLVVLSTDNHEYKWTGSSWTDLGSMSDAYTEYEYVQGNGTSYIKTDYIPNNDTAVEIDCEGFKGSNAALLGTDDQPVGNNQFKIIYVSSNLRFDYCNYESSVNSGISTRGIIRMDSSGGYIDGTKKVSFTNIGTLSDQHGCCCIFAFGEWKNGTDGVSSFSKYTGKIYSFKIYEGETLVRNFVPAEKDGVCGMYETITGTMYGSEVSTPFTVGGNSTEHGIVPEEYDTKVAPANHVEYQTLEQLELMECPWVGMHATVGGVPYIYTANGWEEVEQVYTQYDYVQGNGSSCIMTDYIPKANSSVEVDIEGYKGSDAAIFGSNDLNYGDVANRRFKMIYINGGLRYDYTTANHQTNNSVINTRGILKMNPVGGYHNDTQLATFSGVSGLNNNVGHCGIMCFPDTDVSAGTESISVYNKYTGKIYSVKIYEGETLVRNFVPAEKDGVCGMYETITGTMYGSEVSTPFTVGNE